MGIRDLAGEVQIRIPQGNVWGIADDFLEALREAVGPENAEIVVFSVAWLVSSGSAAVR